MSNWVQSWDECKGDTEWSSLLIGNGLSMNIWNGFGYTKLLEEVEFDEASTSAIFAELDTSNFEYVLEVVMHAEKVVRVRGGDSRDLRNLYKNIQKSLFRVVNRIHVPNDAVRDASWDCLSECLLGFKNVFTTNYDLIPYWALAKGGNNWNRFTDFFGGSDELYFKRLSDVEIPGRMRLYYLHGALHLWQRDIAGITGKSRYELGADLLSQLRDDYSDDLEKRPLFVSEANSHEKRRTIRRSDYLTFALERLEMDKGNIVVFGSTLSEIDDHIVKALAKGNRKKTIAVSLHGMDGEDAHKRWIELTAQLNPHEVRVFRADTHSLGSQILKLSAG